LIRQRFKRYTVNRTCHSKNQESLEFKEGEQVLVTLSSEDKLPYQGSLKKIYKIKIIKNLFLVHAECFSEHTVPLILEEENIILLNRLLFYISNFKYFSNQFQANLQSNELLRGIKIKDI